MGRELLTRSTRRSVDSQRCFIGKYAQILANVGWLYHVTPEAHAESILERGFDPDKAHEINGDLYPIGPFANRHMVFFATGSGLCGVFEMFDDGMSDQVEKMVILRVPASVIAERDFDLDRTHEVIAARLRDSEDPDVNVLHEMLSKVGYVACFDKIPSDKVETVGLVKELRARLCS